MRSCHTRRAARVGHRASGIALGPRRVPMEVSLAAGEAGIVEEGDAQSRRSRREHAVGRRAKVATCA